MPTIAANGAELYYEETGTGAPLVLVHGGFMDHLAWILNVPFLADSLRVVTFDMRGHSASSKVSDVASFDAMVWVDDLIALIEELDLAPTHVGGVSGGGAVVLWAAIRRPDLFRSVIVHEPATVGVLNQPETKKLYETIGVWSADVADHLDRGDFRGGLELFMSRIGGDIDAIPPPFLDILLTNAPLYGGPTLRDLSLPIWNMDPEAFAKTGLPLLVTCGDQSPPYFPTICDDLTSHVPGSRLEVIVGGGHAAMIDRPDAWANTVKTFALKQDAPS